MLKKSVIVSMPVLGFLLWIVLRVRMDDGTIHRTKDLKSTTESSDLGSEHLNSQSAGIAQDHDLSNLSTLRLDEISIEGQAVAKLSTDLSNSEPGLRAGIFNQALVDEDISRLNVLYAAAQYNSEELLGFWNDILNRKLPIGADESSALRLDEPSIIAGMASAEISLALDQVRLLAAESERARAILVDAVKAEGNARYELARKESAFRALNEVDPRRSLQILKEMDPKDPLMSYLVRVK